MSDPAGLLFLAVVACLYVLFVASTIKATLRLWARFEEVVDDE